MEDRVFQAALAGLLHDIGKVVQRSKTAPWKPPEDVDDSGQPVHAAWTIGFVQHYVPERYRAAALAGGYHHHPGKSVALDSDLSRLVALADKLSAGERADVDEKRTRPQLLSIFDRVDLTPEKKTFQDIHYLPLHPLQLDRRVIFPSEKILTEDQAGLAYDDLRQGLERELAVEIEDPQLYLENALSVLQRYTWCVPSAYYHSLPDVSLYDHSRMTAALAVCLAQKSHDEVQSLLTAVENDFDGKANDVDKELLAQPAAMLIGGDISGIQDFIYTISSRKAAKTLRGRSFYLQLLTEAILRYVLRELGLPYTNVIYSGGGHFYILAPLAAEGKLPAIRQYMTDTLVTHHSSALYLAVGWSQVPAIGFKVNEFPHYWDEMYAELNKAKNHRFSELGDQMYARIFTPEPVGGNPDDTCSVCGEDQRKVQPITDEDEAGRICSLCRSFDEEIGARLPGSRFLALGISAPQPGRSGTVRDILAAFGLSYQFLANGEESVTLKADSITLWALDDPVNGWPKTGGRPAARMLRYVVNQVPPHSFDKLQEKAKGGFEKLGVLRMDVDNLGNIFKTGLANSTLARMAALSFSMSLYFEGWVKDLCRRGELSGLIYAVYAGGDDVFLIGPWDRMPDLALAIVDDFEAYTGGNKSLHISGGLAFIGGKYPVYQAAEDAGEAEAKAKKVTGKNAFTFLDIPWKWEEFHLLQERKDQLVRFVGKEEEEGGPQAILQILRSLPERQSKVQKKQGEPVLFGPWLWLGQYQLKRMEERLKEGDKKEFVKKLKTELHASGYQQIIAWAAAARWAQLETRKKSKKEGEDK